jgi:predicted O-methyltransferase YrrM
LIEEGEERVRAVLSASRLLPIGAAVVFAAFALAIAMSLSWDPVPAVLMVVLSAFIGGVLGQTAAWARAGAGSARRAEFALQRLFDVLAVESKKTREAVTSSDITQSRSVENLRKTLEAGDTRLAKSLGKVREEITTSAKASRRQLDDQVALLESYLQLQRLVPLPRPMPRAGAWAASEDLLLWLVGEVLRRQPALIVDLGSGQSSVWMAAALKESGAPGRVVAIDHDADYAEVTRQLAADQGLSRWLDVRHAPLVSVTIEGRTMEFYDPDALADLDEIDLLSIDGPPGSGTEQARWPALPLLRARLAPGAQVVLDDLIRRDEQEIVADWAQRFPHLSLRQFDFEKGAAVFTVPTSGSDSAN